MNLSTFRSLRAVAAATLLLLVALVPGRAAALPFGYVTLGDAFDTDPQTPITAAGHTPVNLGTIATADLSTVDVLWIFNPRNDTYSPDLTANLSKVAAFVRGGGVLSFHDRRVVEAATVLPGGGGVSFTRDLDTTIDVLNAMVTVTNGPAGIIGNTTLDGGNFSNHGYADPTTLPGGAVGVLSTSVQTEVVDFYYPFGAGWVYYSTVPLDFYLDGSGNNPPADQFRQIYAVNEAAFQAELTGVPEPATVALLGAGLVGFGVMRKRRS